MRVSDTICGVNWSNTTDKQYFIKLFTLVLIYLSTIVEYIQIRLNVKFKRKKYEYSTSLDKI